MFRGRESQVISLSLSLHDREVLGCLEGMVQMDKRWVGITDLFGLLFLDEQLEEFDIFI